MAHRYKRRLSMAYRGGAANVRAARRSLAGGKARDAGASYRALAPLSALICALAHLIARRGTTKSLAPQP